MKSVKDPLSETLNLLESNLSKTNQVSESVITTLDNFVTRFSNLTNEMESMNKSIQDYKLRHQNIDLTIRKLDDISENFDKPYKFEERLRKKPNQIRNDLPGFLDFVLEIKTSKKFFQQNHFYKSYDKAIQKLRDIDQVVILKFHKEFKSLLEDSTPLFSSGKDILTELYMNDPKYTDTFLKSIKSKNLEYIDDYLESLGSLNARFLKILSKIEGYRIVRAPSYFYGGMDDKNHALLLPFLCLLSEQFSFNPSSLDLFEDVEERDDDFEDDEFGELKEFHNDRIDGKKEDEDNTKLFFMKIPELIKLKRICNVLSKEMKNNEFLNTYIQERPKCVSRMFSSMYYTISKSRKNRRRRNRSSSISSKGIERRGYVRLRSNFDSSSNQKQDSKKPEKTGEQSSSSDSEDDEPTYSPIAPIGGEGHQTNIAVGSSTNALFERNFYHRGSHPFLYYVKFFLRYLEEEKHICSLLLPYSVQNLNAISPFLDGSSTPGGQVQKLNAIQFFGRVIHSNLQELVDHGLSIANPLKHTSSDGMSVIAESAIVSQQSEQFFILLDLLSLYDISLREEYSKILKVSSLSTSIDESELTKKSSKKKVKKKKNIEEYEGEGETLEDEKNDDSGGKLRKKRKYEYFELIDSLFQNYRRKVIDRFIYFQQKELLNYKISKKKELLATIHPSIPIAFTFFKRLLNYAEIVEKLLIENFPFSRKITTLGISKKKNSGGYSSYKCIGEYIKIVIQDTIALKILNPIATKSRGKSEILSVLFELNNYHHILTKLNKIKQNTVSSQVLKTYQMIVRKTETHFVNITWDKSCQILQKVIEDNPDLKVKKNRKVIKNKYRDWQKMWIKLTLKIKLPVLNRKLRERIIQATKDKVVTVFKEFLEVYEQLLMTDRGLLKYNVKTVRDTIENMYLDE